MKIKLKIEQPGYNQYTGSNHYNVTSFLVSHSKKKAKNLNKFGEEIYTSRRGGYSYAKRAEDPVFDALAKTMDSIFFKGTYGDNLAEFYAEMTFKYSDGNIVLLISKDRGFTLNGKKMNKAILLSVLARIAYRSCFVRSRAVLKPYLRDLLQVPPNVRWALENRTPYYFYDEDEENPYRREKVEILLNTRRISKTQCALELSDNIWAAIDIDALDKFLNVYRLGQMRSKKWKQISPKGLWSELFKTSPSSSEEAVMKSFLMQNRTEDMVENRAKKLMDELSEENEGILNFKLNVDGSKEGKQVMFVRGKLCDWVLIENGAAKTSPQRVSIYCYHERVDAETYWDNYDTASTVDINYTSRFFNGKLRGPICVNNSVGNVSLGDQFASRAFTLLNDKLSFQMVSTLKGYTPESLWNETKREHRLDYDVLKEWVAKGCILHDVKTHPEAMNK